MKYKALQYPGEVEDMISVFRKHDVRSYLEIGSKFGGSLWPVGSSLPQGSRIVSVDLSPAKEVLESLQHCLDQLKKRGYDVHYIDGDSTKPETISQIRNLGPYDACFIDANHTLPYVTQDWENYGPMCKLVAFHDINFYRAILNPKKTPIDVPKFWTTLKTKYQHVEFRRDRQDNGIGILWNS